MSNSTIFTGSSRYANDLQQVLTRAVAIASLPLKQLNNQLATIQTQSAALDTLNSTFGSLRTALGNLDSSAASATATVSDPSVVSALADPATLPGTYSINVISPGSPTSAFSLDGLPTVADPSSQSISAATSFSLSVGGVAFTINPASNSLNALADAINTSGAGVSATIINIGGPSAPDYRLALQSTALDNVPISLNDGGQELLQILVAGTSGQYQVNGLPNPPITSTSRTITVAPGLTAVLLTTGTANIVISRTSSALSNALASFVAAYNAAVDGIAIHHGSNAGPLLGDPVLATLSRSLRTVNGYTGSTGAIQSLADLGVSLDKNGKLSIDQANLDAALQAHGADVASFLGSASTGGFLKVASDELNNLEDSATGVLPSLQAAFQQRITAQNDAISAEQTRIDLMQASLTARIGAADALIATLEQQVTYFTTLFDSMNNNGKSK